MLTILTILSFFSPWTYFTVGIAVPAKIITTTTTAERNPALTAILKFHNKENGLGITQEARNKKCFSCVIYIKCF